MPFTDIVGAIAAMVESDPTTAVAALEAMGSERGAQVLECMCASHVGVARAAVAVARMPLAQVTAHLAASVVGAAGAKP